MPEPFKNMYNQRFFDMLTGAFQAVEPGFDRAGFLAGIFDADWEGRELKARMRHISHTLRRVLPDDYRAALDIARRAAARIEAFGFETIVFPDFVEVYGLDDWEASLPALEQFTQQSSAEFAVRPFIMRDSARMMAHMLGWAGHASHHVRRLASEGCRPRLPWGMTLPAFKADPAPILPILEQLRDDESEYVRRSVANNLNDIAKDNPQVVLATVRRWREQRTPELDWVINRALRTLVKDGDPEALALLGYQADTAAVAVHDLTVTPDTLAIGQDVIIAFTVESRAESSQALLIDYIVHHQRANGVQTPKVFKLTKTSLAPGARLNIVKKHSFRPVTTRRYYPGEHAVEIQINGVVYARQEFRLAEA